MRLDLRIGDEIAAAGFQVVEAFDLTGHLKLAAHYRIVPAFDVDRTTEPGSAQVRDDRRPVAIAKPRRAVIRESRDTPWTWRTISMVL